MKFEATTSGVVPDDRESSAVVAHDGQSSDITAGGGEKPASESESDRPMTKRDELQEAWEQFHREHPDDLDLAPPGDKYYKRRYQKPPVLGHRYAIPLNHDPSGDAEDSAPDKSEIGARTALPPPRDRIANVQEILGSAGFTQDEVEYALVNSVDNVSRDDIPKWLPGWSASRVDRARKGVYRKCKQLAGAGLPVEIKRCRGSSVYLTYLDEVMPGHFVVSLSEIIYTPEFAEEMNRAVSKSLAVKQLPKTDDLRHLLRGARKVFFMIPIPTVSDEEVMVEAERRGFGQSWCGYSKQYVTDNIRGQLAYRKQLKLDEEQVARIAALGDLELESALKEAGVTLHNVCEQLEKARAERRTLNDNVKLAFKDTADEEIRKLEAEQGTICQKLTWIRDEMSFRRRKAQDEANSKNAPKIQAMIDKTLEYVGDRIPKFENVEDLSERHLLAQITRAMMSLKLYREQKKALVA